MSSKSASKTDGLVVAGPIASEIIAVLELARQALSRVDQQPWGEFEGPSIESIIRRISKVQALQDEFMSELTINK